MMSFQSMNKPLWIVLGVCGALLAGADSVSARDAIAPPELAHLAIAAPEQAPPALQASEPVAPPTRVRLAQQVAPTPTPAPHPLALSVMEASDPMAQVTSVTQFADVAPGDWAYDALSFLANSEQEGGLDCLEGYPDGTYRGQRALTRYEFAAGLAACLDAIEERILAGGGISPEALERIEALQREFAAELAALRSRVDALESAVAELEENQFSTTTKLVGEAIFSINDIFGDQVDDGGINNTVFQWRLRLDLQTSFTGEDTLHTRLSAGDREPFLVPGSFGGASTLLNGFNIVPRGTAEGVQASDIGAQTDGGVEIDWLGYYFPIGDRLQAYVSAYGGNHSDYVNTINPYFEDYDGGNGSISAFSQQSPIYRIGGGSGGALTYTFDDNGLLALSLGYLAETANDVDTGFFSGDYAALGQLTIRPSNSVELGLTYVHGYHTETVDVFGTSTTNAIFDLGVGNNFFTTGTVPGNAVHGALGVPAVTNSYGIQASWQLNPDITLNAFGGYTNLTLIETGNGDIWYYGLGIALPDLFADGNLGGIMVGVEPYLAGLSGLYSLDDIGVSNDTSLHIEAFYRWQVTDNISLTPGVIYVTAPEQNSDNDPYVVATLRTTFRF